MLTTVVTVPKDTMASIATYHNVINVSAYVSFIASDTRVQLLTGLTTSWLFTMY